MFPASHGIVSQGGQGGDAPPAARRAIALLPATGGGVSTSGSLGWRFFALDDLLLTHLHGLTGAVTDAVMNLSPALGGGPLVSAPYDAENDLWTDILLASPLELPGGSEYILWFTNPNGSFPGRTRDPEETAFDPAILYITGTASSAKLVPTAPQSSLRGIGDFSFTASTPRPRGVRIAITPEASLLNQRVGWQFLVGDAPLTVTHVRALTDGTVAERVRIHRVSDGALIVSADITPTPYVSTRAPVTPVVLAANTEYVISARATTGAIRTIYRNPALLEFAPEVTLAGYRFGTNDNAPASVTANSYGFVDFEFTT